METTWKCTYCGEEGTSYPPEECPTCEQCIQTLEAGVRLQIQGWQATQTRIEDICRLLDYGHRTVEIYYDEVRLTWEEKRCSHSNCPSEHKEARFPISYLWMTDKDIREATK